MRNDITELQSLQTLYSDLHKDVYGVRPRYNKQRDWYSKEFLRKEIDSLGKKMEAAVAEENAWTEYQIQCEKDWRERQLTIAEQVAEREANDLECYWYDKYEV